MDVEYSLDRKEARISTAIRVVSGMLGILGFAAIAFNAFHKGDLKLDLLLFASFFAGFVFLYVAFFGKYPWD
jgi:hypothetical protein